MPLLIDDHIIWEEDVSDNLPGKETKHSVDLTSYLQDKPSAIIAFRLYKKESGGRYLSHIGVSIANIRTQGFKVVNPDFTDSIGWTFNSTSGVSVHYRRHKCDPNRQQHMFNAVKKLYSSWQGH